MHSEDEAARTAPDDARHALGRARGALADAYVHLAVASRYDPGLSGVADIANNVDDQRRAIERLLSPVNEEESD